MRNYRVVEADGAEGVGHLGGAGGGHRRLRQGVGEAADDDFRGSRGASLPHAVRYDPRADETRDRLLRGAAMKRRALVAGAVETWRRGTADRQAVPSRARRRWGAVLLARCSGWAWRWAGGTWRS